MAINYAVRYSNKVDEKFYVNSLTTPAVNQDYDFVGVNSVNVYSVPTVATAAYTMSGIARYGTPTEIQDTIQTLTMTQDKAFTATIDRRNYTDTMMVKEAGAWLDREIREILVPELDIYRLTKIIAGAGTTTAATPITSSNAYASFLAATGAFLDNKIPLDGAICYAGSNFYKQIRQDKSFILQSEITQNMLIKGQVGTIDGIPLIYAPSTYLTTGTGFVIVNKIACPSPVKIVDYKTHDNPPGINGWLIEGRLLYDCFVLTNKTKAIYVHKEA